jgi:hypothetical protein
MKITIYPAGVSLLVLLSAVSSLNAKQDSLVISVYANASGSYQRQILPDGNIKPQTYVVGDGGIAGQPSSAGAGDSVPFPTVVRLLARKLVQQGYYPARNGMAADLLLVLFWGETTPFSDAHLQNANANLSSAMSAWNAAEKEVKLSMDRGEDQSTRDGIQIPIRSARDAVRDNAESQFYQAQLFEQMRLKADESNARLLGYVEEINRWDNPNRYAGARDYFTDLMDDIETPRYYVIVQAYDFPAAVNESRRKLLWTTRISIPASGSNFNQCLPAMVAEASRYFGRTSGRLIRRYREGVVRLGELEVVGVDPDEDLAERKPDGAR